MARIPKNYIYRGLPGWKSLGFKSYQDYLDSDWWKRKRTDLISNKCSECGIKTNLNLHHIDYEWSGMENYKDVITLCNKCHKKRHNIK